MEEIKFFSPPYCPNLACINHKEPGGSEKPFWRRKGFDRRRFSEKVQCFQCKACNKVFTKSTFSLNYRLHKRGHLNARIFFGVVHNRSNRSIARELGVSECLIRTRILRLARVGLARHARFIEDLRISEPIAYDGLECFARSQYEPNNINQAIGVNSLFCYTFNFAPLNRKGRMSLRQRRYLEKLEGKEGRFDPRAIRRSTEALFRELIQRKDPTLSKLTIHTDEHFQYRRALERDLSALERAQIEHVTVSSKATRNYKNILFAVNHMDLLSRRYVAAFSRETICFAKKHSRMIHKYLLFTCYKNYMKPQFVKAHKSDSRAHTHSPSMFLGLTTKLMSFQDFFGEPLPLSHCKKMSPQWLAIAHDTVPFQRSFAFC